MNAVEQEIDIGMFAEQVAILVASVKTRAESEVEPFKLQIKRCPTLHLRSHAAGSDGKNVIVNTSS